jgi:hypothetical protein
MVDRIRRDQLAQLLRQFVDGRTTNREYEDHANTIACDRKRRSNDDPAIMAVCTKAYFLYDDIRTHRMTGRWKLRPEHRTEVARWIVFLHSDFEYRWPVSNFVRAGTLGCLVMIATLGLAGLFWKGVLPQMKSEGDEEVWPFFTRSDYEQALMHPRLLAGQSGRSQSV